MFRSAAALALLWTLLVSASHPVEATTLQLSVLSSDGTPAASLGGELSFAVVGGTQLELTVTNTGSDFTIRELYWNASGDVTGLTLTSATHDVHGDVLSAWGDLAAHQRAGGFGHFDFALRSSGGGSSSAWIRPGEQIVFVFDIAGTGPFTPADFVEANRRDLVAAAKFVMGPADPECAGAVVPTAKCPQGVLTEDSAFGGVPEPGSGWLLGLALAGAAVVMRRSA